MISDTEVREYPFGKIASHLIGYVQNVTAEDLENMRGRLYGQQCDWKKRYGEPFEKRIEREKRLSDLYRE